MSGVKRVAVGLSGVLLCWTALIVQAEETTSLKFVRQVELTAEEWSGLGCSVSTSGERIVVGARLDEDAGAHAGAAYVFRHDGWGWIREQKLIAGDADPYDLFGYATAIAGDTIVVGTPYDDVTGYNSGAVYVFRHDGTNWVQERKLVAADGGSQDYFGRSVAIAGDTIVVGADLDDDRAHNAGTTYVFRHDGAGWLQEQKLIAVDGSAHDYFGRSLAIAGDTIVVGAHGDDDNGSASGSAYVFRRHGTTWLQEQKLIADDGSASDRFGWSTAAADDAVVVGARNHRYGFGSAYVFRYDGARWIQEQKLIAADGYYFDYFGQAVAIDGDTIAVGAYLDDDRGLNSGSAYVFRRDGAGWVQDQKLTALHGLPGDRLGSSVALAAGRLVAGAPDGKGAAYAHTQGLNHVPVADAGPDLLAECTSPQGRRVTLDGSASTDLDSTPGTHDAIVRFDWFEDLGFSGERWIDRGETCEVTFGLGVHDVTLVVEDFPGATDRDEVVVEVRDSTPPEASIFAPAPGSCHGRGAVPVWVRAHSTDFCDPSPTSSWSPPNGVAKLLAPDGNRFDYFGISLAIDGDAIVVGAYHDDDRGTGSGSAYVFRRDGAGWGPEQKLLAADADRYDYFGYAVALEGDRIVIGAPYDDDNGPFSGSVYAFRRDGTTWVQEQELLAADGGSYDRFGCSTAFDGRRIVVGAWGDEDKGPYSGSVYVFRREGAEWVEEQKLVAADGQRDDSFGYTVAFDGQRIAVGAAGDDDLGSSSGAVYVFRHDGARWVQEQKLLAPDGRSGDWFGDAVALEGDRLVVGASGDDDRGRDSGSVYVFRHDGANWAPEQKLLASEGERYDYFGYTLAFDGDRLVVGAAGDDDRGHDAGAAYLFRHDGASWSQQLKLSAVDGSLLDYFSDALALDDGTIAVGVPYDDDHGSNSGSVYVFRHDELYCHHGDYRVTLTVEDDAGNAAGDAVEFTVDLVPPAVELLGLPQEPLLPSVRPFAELFACRDDDEATGEPVHERLLWDDCLVYDGLSYGDGDGLLGDETLVFDRPTLCQAMARCGLTELRNPTLRFEGFDCAGNRGFAERTHLLRISTEDCGPGTPGSAGD